MSAVSDFVRKSFKEGDDIRDAGLTTPEDVVRYDDILYGTDPKWQVLDLYRPKNKEGEKLPVIVSIHGGGWVYGDKERYQYYCMSLAERGFAVVNFTYRLAPEFKYPAPLEDTNLVFSWVLEHEAEYNLDTRHIFAVGDSAGGNILGLYCAICTNPEYAGHPSPDNHTLELMADYLPGKGTREEMVLMNVTAHVTEKFPPVFLMTASGDFLKEQALLMASVLTRHNVPFLYRFYGDSQNLLPHVFHCDMRSEDGKQCNQDECDYFLKFCK